MDSIFTPSEFVLKRQGLSIAGKYRLFNMQSKDPILYIEQKSKLFPPSFAYHVYADDKKKREVLTLKDRPEGYGDDMDVFDAQSGQLIGSLVNEADTFSELFKDVWAILNAEGKTVGKVYEKSLSKSLMRELITHDLPQRMEIKVGEIEVGELRQKVKPIGYELAIDISKDVSSLLDHRLAVAAALVVAYHQGTEMDV